MKKKRRHAEIEQSQGEQQQPVTEEPSTEETAEKVVEEEAVIPDQIETTDNSFREHRQKKFKQVYSRVSVDPSRRYHTPESRESWGPNVKGKKFRKEKGKKKRCPNAGVRIDGSVKSIRLDA